MSIRTMLEEHENAFLSVHAVRSSQSRGRELPIVPCELRMEFQRDRDRIIHSKAFRRLKHKTQMFLAPRGDHYRTRLTHTMEVSQIARTIARALRLNEDLTEAISLGHDLGHTPFGHTGERTLDRLLTSGFSHSQQSLRVVEVLEQDGNGLNLTFEVRDGILHHSMSGNPSTLEGKIVSLADRIAYINHDIDDAIRGGMLDHGALPRECLKVLGKTHGDRISTMVRDIVTVSTDEPWVRMSKSVQDAMNALRQFLFDKVYSITIDPLEEERAAHVMEHLFVYYMDHTDEIATMQDVEKWGKEQVVCDYIAGMTDGFAISEYRNIFIPKPYSG